MARLNFRHPRCFWALAHNQAARNTTPLQIGVADSGPKAVACRVVEPALRLADPLRPIGRVGRLASLLGEMAVHRLDLVVADQPLRPELHVRDHDHRRRASEVTVFATTALVLVGPPVWRRIAARRTATR